MKKKLLSLLFVACLTVSLVACGGGSSDNAGGNSGATSTASTEQYSNEEHPGWLCEDKTTLTVLTYDAVNNTYPTPSNDLPFWKWLEDYTNVHIEWEIVPYAGFEEVMQTRVSSGSDLADIVMTNDVNISKNAGINGIFADLDPYWDSCFTNIDAYFDKEGTDYRSLLKNEDGSVYGICGTVNPVEGHIVIMYNTEWMDKLGLEIPNTVDEFRSTLEAMKAAGDINGNGEADEVIFSSSGVETLSSVMGNAFGLNAYEAWDQFSVDGSGTVYPEYTSDNQKAYLEFLNGLYKDGLLDPEITSMSADMLSEKIASDRVGVFIYYSAFAITYGSLTSAGVEDPMGEHYTIGMPLASSYNNNSAYFVKRSIAKSQSTSVNADCENIDLACRWLDTMFADPEVLLVRTCGFEGEDFEYDANGNIQLIYPADGSAWAIVNKGCGQIALPFIQTKEQLLNSKMQYDWYLAQYDVIRDDCKWVDPSISNVTVYTDFEQEIRDEYRTDVVDYWHEMRDKFITGQASLSSDWDKYIESIDKLGLPQFTEMYQSIYDRTK